MEIQRAEEGAGARRARFHGSMIDRDLLGKGKDFDELPESFVIFITEEDMLMNTKTACRCLLCVVRQNLLKVSPKSKTANGFIYSIAETAKANNLKPPAECRK